MVSTRRDYEQPFYLTFLDIDQLPKLKEFTSSLSSKENRQKNYALILANFNLSSTVAFPLGDAWYHARKDYRPKWNTLYLMKICLSDLEMRGFIVLTVHGLPGKTSTVYAGTEKLFKLLSNLGEQDSTSLNLEDINPVEVNKQPIDYTSQTSTTQPPTPPIYLSTPISLPLERTFLEDVYHERVGGDTIK